MRHVFIKFVSGLWVVVSNYRLRLSKIKKYYFWGYLVNNHFRVTVL